MGMAIKTIVNPLFLIQKRIIHLIVNVNNDANTSPFFKDLGIFKVHDIYITYWSVLNLYTTRFTVINYLQYKRHFMSTIHTHVADGISDPCSPN